MTAALYFAIVWALSFAAAQSGAPRFRSFNLIKPPENFVHTIGRIVLIPEEINRQNIQSGITFRHDVPNLFKPPLLLSNRHDHEENIKRNQEENHQNHKFDSLRDVHYRKEINEFKTPSFHGPPKFNEENKEFNESKIITEPHHEKPGFKTENNFHEITKEEPDPFELNPNPVQIRKPNAEENGFKINKKLNNLNKEAEKPQEIIDDVDHDDDSKKITTNNDSNDELTILDNDIEVTEDDSYTTTEDYETTTDSDLFNRMGNIPPALLASLVG